MGFTSDISIPAILFSLGISLLLVAILGLFITQKMNEQNHKISSMFELVSTLANELNMVRGHVMVAGSAGPSVQNNKMIHVSDDEFDANVEFDEDSDNDEDDDEETDEENDDSEESDDGSEDEKEGETIEIIDEPAEDIKVVFINNFDAEDMDGDAEADADADADGENEKTIKNIDTIVFDYKKASLTKLRSMVVEKGLIEDASKLKKQDLLKLLDLD